MAKSIVETTVEVYSPWDWKFRVKTTIKFEIEKIEPKLKDQFLVIYSFFEKKCLIPQERQKKVKCSEKK